MRAGFQSIAAKLSRPLCLSLCSEPPKCLLCTSLSPAEKYLANLQKNGSNIERTLDTVRAKLDVKCVNLVLERCALDKPLLGLRFFVWSGFQPNYRHCSFMYSKACKLFEINQNPRRVTDLLEAYRVENCVVNVKMCKVVLNLCKQAKSAAMCLLVMRKMKEFNIRPDTTVYNTVIRLFCEKGDMDTATNLMKDMGLIDLLPDMITHIAMIKGFCEVGRLEEACQLLKGMKQHGCPPNAVAFSALLDGICRLDSAEKALEFLSVMEKGDDCKPNVVTYTSVIQGFCEKGKSVEAMNILDHMNANGCAPNRITVATLIEGLLKECRLEEAYILIDKVIAFGGVSSGECYSSLVVGLWRTKKVEEAEKLFRKMLANAVRPDGLASSILIKGLVLQGRALDAYHLYSELDKLEFIFSIDSDVYSILVSELCRDSHFVEAKKLAGLMVERRIQVKAAHIENIVQYPIFQSLENLGLEIKP